jgi:hypothetical protein
VWNDRAMTDMERRAQCAADRTLAEAEARVAAADRIARRYAGPLRAFRRWWSSPGRR